MMKKIFLSLTAIFLFIFFPTVALADMQIYPKGYGNTAGPGGVADSRDKCFGKPVSYVEPRDNISYIASTAECGGEGNYYDDTTEPPGAINHRAGQTFYLPEKRVISKVRWGGFIGAEGQTLGGKVRVVLRQGNGNGPEIASAIAYVTGWQYNNWLAPENTSFCRWQINDPNSPLSGNRLDSLDGPCLLKTLDYATSWAVMPYVTPMEIDLTKFSPSLPPGKYSIEIIQDAGGPGGPDQSHNIVQGLFNRFNALNQIAAYYQDSPSDDYDAIWEWYWPGPQNGRDLSGLAVFGKAVPRASVTGPATGTANQAILFSGTAQDPDGNLTQEEIWVTTSNYTLPSGCSRDNTSGNFCLVGRYYLSGGNASFSGAWTPPSAGTYIVQVNAMDSDNLRCAGNPRGIGDGSYWKDTCGPQGSMEITVSGLPPTLKVNNGATPSRTGAYKISGLEAADGGSNWLNPINISLSASGTVTDYYVSFYERDSGSKAASSLSEIQTRLNGHPERGFILRYSSAGYSTWNTCQGGWESLPYTAAACNSSTSYYTVSHPSDAMWKVEFNPAFGNKNMYTAVQASGTNTTTFSGEVQPYPN